MYPPSFEYRRASSVREAIEMLAQWGGRARLLAGGHSLIPLMKLRLASPEALVDIGRVGEMRGIRVSDGQLVVGALTTHHELETSPVVRQYCPVLAEAASVIGDPQVRNRGTVGGNLAHADPASELPAVAVALDARMVAVGPAGQRTVEASNFFLGMLTTALAGDEVLTEVRFPARARMGGQRLGMAYAKLPHPASGYAVVGVAAVVSLDDAGACCDVRVGVTGVADRAYRASATEQALTGRQPGPAAIEEAAALATDGVDVQGDPLYASAEYRAHLCRVYVKRALAEAARRAQAA
ncbi:MAG: xanthine dehydrogenase family protein subunit M [Bacillota bacterium]